MTTTQQIDARAIIKKLDRIRDLPTLPVVAMEVNKLIQDESASIKTITQAIEKDQSIVSKLLKLVNSAFYGVSSKVTSVNEAVVLLGFNTLRNVVVSVSVVKVFASQKVPDGFNMADLWQHSASTAILTKYLLQRGCVVSGDSFVGGLLHDVGKIVMVQHFPELFYDIIRFAEDEGVSFREAEKAVSPIGHARIGAYLVKRWHLPPRLINCIEFHHMPDKTKADLELVATVHAANILANSLVSKDTAGNELQKMDKEVARKFAAPLRNIQDWIMNAKSDIDELSTFFFESPS
ncbi:MAG: HDOD domain-containing protein [Thermodesulfobacteriota bacterium]|nr:HDOD domain-containing protein [Thermodesulfobacteriota bacterium]